MVQRVVYNTCFGGFSFNESVVEWVREYESSLKEEYDESDVDELAERTLKGEYYNDDSGPKTTGGILDVYISRDNELLADIVSHTCEYDGPVDGRCASLSVAEVPDGIEWTINGYDGRETVEEKSRTFR